MIQIPEFKTKSELFAHLRANKQLYMSAKKSMLKQADPVSFQHLGITDKNGAEKAVSNPELLKLDEFNVKVAISTSNIMDSHSDVHMPGMWNKSIKETKNLYHLQEHKMQFDKIISDNVKASVKQMTWKELGENYDGVTEVLVFDSAIDKSRNPYMAEQYAKGRVKNHSVGMRYVKLLLAINSDEKYDREEKEVWDKYIDQVVNKTEAEEQGYFWVVLEAKVIEGSAVPLGSNQITPTISIGKALEESRESTKDEPIDQEIIKSLEKLNQLFN